MKYAKRRTAKALALSAFLLGLAGAAQAWEIETISSGGKEMFNLYYLDKTENTGYFVPENDEATGLPKVPYTLNAYLKSGVETGVRYWADILAAGSKNTTPLPIYVHGVEKYQNASAAEEPYKDGKEIYSDYWIMALQNNYQLYPLDPTKMEYNTKTQLYTYNGKPVDHTSFSDLTLGEYLGAYRESADYRGWWTAPLSNLPDGEQAGDLDGTFRHEMGHALGIAAARYNVKDEKGNNKKDGDGLTLMYFSTDTINPNGYTWHLVDENLNPAKPGMEIITPREFSRRNELAGGTLKQSDYFILSNVDNKKWKDGSRTGKAYFIGSHVSEVLDGKTFDGVSGLRINGWESKMPELSHVQSDGMMSHNPYSNYTAFMEVELALMEDLGYTLDRRKWFGRSIYTDGNTLTNTQGYYERNADGTAYLEGTPSTANLGVGLHLYGSNNTVTQAADLLADGMGATGVRVDGQGNKLTLPAGTKITANGIGGYGVLFAYGRNHTFTQQGTVEANGDKGVGVRFDFGSSTNGAGDEYRGSYIRFDRSIDKETGAISSSSNLVLSERAELNGPLVSDYTLSGSLSGSEYAIYIGRNAFVKNINVKGGATITGNIYNDWRHFDTDGSYDAAKASADSETDKVVKEALAELDALKKTACEGRETDNDEESDATYPLNIQYNGSYYTYDTPIDDLFTNLNFAGDVTYAGDITGIDNTHLNAKSGTLTYSGFADVASVTVDKGATLKGGTYAVHDLKGSYEYADAKGATKKGTFGTDTGKFTNHGTLQPDGADMTIMGAKGTEVFQSDGTFAIALKNSSTAYQVAVKDMSAIVGGSVVAPVAGASYSRGTKYTFLTAPRITGTFGQKAGDSFSDLLTINELDHDSASAWLILDVDESAAGSDGEKAVLAALADSDDPAASAILAAGGGAGKAMLAAAAENPAADAAALTIRSGRVAKAVRARTGWLNDIQTEPRKAHYWFKTDKDWSRYGSGAIKGSGWGFTLGADWQTGRGWTVGLLGQYGHDSWNLGESSWNKHKVKDWRFGVYAVNRTGQNELSAHLAIGRQTHANDRIAAGITSPSRFHSSTQELGLRFARDLTPGKTWHHKPFAQLQLTRYRQDAFDESGAPWALHSDSVTKIYSAGTIGWGVERAMKDGSFGFSLGYKRVFSGDDPAVWTRVSGRDGGWKADARKYDRNLFVAGAQGEWVLGKCWSANFGLELEQGRHDRNLSAKAAFVLSW